MTASRWLEPEEQRMWRRYREVNQLLELALERQLQRESALSMADYGVLVELSESEGLGLRARDLGTRLGWDRSRVSHQVRRMEGRDLVRKEPCAEDGRGTVVVLTERGAATIRAAAPDHVTQVRELFVDQLTPAQLATLTEVFEKVIARIDEVEGISLPS